MYFSTTNCSYNKINKYKKQNGGCTVHDGDLDAIISMILSFLLNPEIIPENIWQELQGLGNCKKRFAQDFTGDET